VFEGVHRLGRLATHKEDLRFDQTRQPLPQGGVFQTRHRGQQRVRELPSQHGGSLRHLLGR
jgi:hypothetical protein